MNIIRLFLKRNWLISWYIIETCLGRKIIICTKLWKGIKEILYVYIRSFLVQ